MIHHLIYHSYATADINLDFIESILNESKKINAENNVTGCLLVNDHQFIQLLEGDQNVLEKIFQHIKNDTRNRDVSLIDNKMVEERMFPMSSMVYDVVGKDDFEKIGVKGNADLSFFRNDPAKACQLFTHIRQLIEKEPMRQGLWHNSKLGPLT